MDLAAVTLATFEPCVGDTFAIEVPTGAIELVLAKASSAGDWPGRRQPFDLRFRGPRERILEQAIYRLEHAELGALEIFIVPIGRDATSTTYQAIFT